MSEHKEHKLDQNLYSRQIGAFGMETMAKLVKMDVLLCGMRGLGAEIAKNLILAGPRSVTIYDEHLVEKRDLGANFLLSEADVGKKCSVSCVKGLAELNEYVTVSAHTAPLTDAFIHNFDVIVMTNSSRAEAERVNAYARARMKKDKDGNLVNVPIGFIYVDVRGLTGLVFTDFGDTFEVHDPNGEPTHSSIVTGITKANPGVVTVHEDQPHQLETGDYVVFSEVEGMVQLNDGVPRRITVIDRFNYSIGDTSSYDAYTRQGLASQVKVPQPVPFQSLRAAARHPFPNEQHMICADLFKGAEQVKQLHLAYQALWAFQEEKNRLPALNDADDAKAVVSHADKILQAHRAFPAGTALVVDKLDEALITKVALHAAAELSPLAALFGGIAAQEVVKLTGKFSPLRQPLYLDFLEALPQPAPSAEETKALDSRYDDQIAVFGRGMQDKLAALRLFLVGAGALGCEYLKGFALMGVATEKGKGLVTVTDMDNIELSNLNRQFLFRRGDIGKPKSVVASRVAQRMNPDLQCNAMEVRVGTDTEATFNDAFWAKVDVVVNALDNVQARRYMDDKCVFYNKPLLESGTLGPKGNSQVVVPHKTQSYNDVKDAPETAIPLCTLKNFPFKIEHCIEYARAQFATFFETAPQNASLFIRDPQAYYRSLNALQSTSQRIENLQDVLQTIKFAQNATLETCLQEAHTLYAKSFRDTILDITNIYPENHVDPKTGALYWSGPKRFPKPVEPNVDDPETLHFYMAVTNLLAHAFNVTDPKTGKIVENRDLKYFHDAIAKLPRVEYVSTKVKVEEDGKEAKKSDDNLPIEQLEAEMKQYEDLQQQLESMIGAGDKENKQASSMKPPAPLSFEKDDDSNFHIDFITAFSNLRARNYRIPEASRHHCKMIAGKIIPAIATTTASITGLMLIELYKLVQNKSLEQYRDSCLSLAINMYVLMEPTPPKQTKSYSDEINACEVKAIPEGFTSWDQLVIDQGDLTLKELVGALEQKLEQKLNLSMLNVGNSMIYSSSDDATVFDEKVSSLAESMCGEPLPGRDYWVLSPLLSNGDGDDLVLPRLIYYFRHTATA